MSVKAMAIVWEADLPRAEKFILLAMADHADHNGENIYPALSTIAWKTGYTNRAVVDIVGRLREMVYWKKLARITTTSLAIEWSSKS